MVWVAGALDASTTAELLALYQEWQRLTAAQVSKNQVPLFFTTLFLKQLIIFFFFLFFWVISKGGSYKTWTDWSIEFSVTVWSPSR